jgi:hypothetical protein
MSAAPAAAITVAAAVTIRAGPATVHVTGENGSPVHPLFQLHETSALTWPANIATTLEAIARSAASMVVTANPVEQAPALSPSRAFDPPARKTGQQRIGAKKRKAMGMVGVFSGRDGRLDGAG